MDNLRRSERSRKAAIQAALTIIARDGPGQLTFADLSLLRWAAARGLVIMGLLGQCPFTPRECERLFDRLLDESRWPTSAAIKPRRTRRRRRVGLIELTQQPALEAL